MVAIRPIKPGEIARQKREGFPSVVLEVFNELIAQNYSGGSSVVRQNDIVKYLIRRGLAREDIFKNNWLDVEEIYRAAGWAVEYESPTYGDSFFEAYFRFRGK